MSYLEAIRCDCNRLIGRGNVDVGYLEIICGKCGTLNQIGTLAT